VLPCSGFGYYTFRAESFRKQGLANRVVNFVCTRVCEILALDPDFGTPRFA
jgi:hypothetical protein